MSLMTCGFKAKQAKDWISAGIWVCRCCLKSTIPPVPGRTKVNKAGTSIVHKDDPLKTAPVITDERTDGY